MNNKNQFLKRVYILSSILVVVALLLTGCDGTISFQGSAKQNEEGGVDISGGVQPDTAVQPETAPQQSGGTNMDQTTIILIGVGVAFFILLLVLVAGRGRSRGGPQS